MARCFGSDRYEGLVVTNQVKRTTISILRRTKDALDSMKHPGQSYDGLIQELIKFWEQKKEDYWTRRKGKEHLAVESGQKER